MWYGPQELLETGCKKKICHAETNGDQADVMEHSNGSLSIGQETRPESKVGSVAKRREYQSSKRWVRGKPGNPRTSPRHMTSLSQARRMTTRQK